ncbi:unnamed protein product [Blepharisma stoltei]|uniref:Uncharacterized protein n=1 Tax=Blepharisma stoltei TaxID=1481888 RepID=A0AAU9JXQ7_9CILI|nr:unnamed protein product [Blepharisma stoltei]
MITGMSKTTESSFVTPKKPLKDKISLISKSLYKVDLSYNPLLDLERSVIRGEAKDIKDAKPKRKPKISADRLTETLKLEHKTQAEGMRILSLPRLPYGNHKTYNDESGFVTDHFITDEDIQNDLNKAKALDEITRKFRIKEKRLKYVQNMQSRKAARLSQTEDFFSFESDGGHLMCNRVKEVIETYDAEKEKYSQKHPYVHLTFKDLEELKGRKRIKFRTQTDWTYQSMMTERLAVSKREVKRPKLLESQNFKMLEGALSSSRPLTCYTINLI